MPTRNVSSTDELSRFVQAGEREEKHHEAKLAGLPTLYNPGSEEDKR